MPRVPGAPADPAAHGEPGEGVQPGGALAVFGASPPDQRICKRQLCRATAWLPLTVQFHRNIQQPCTSLTTLHRSCPLCGAKPKHPDVLCVPVKLARSTICIQRAPSFMLASAHVSVQKPRCRVEGGSVAGADIPAAGEQAHRAGEPAGQQETELPGVPFAAADARRGCACCYAWAFRSVWHRAGTRLSAGSPGKDEDVRNNCVHGFQCLVSLLAFMCHSCTHWHVAEAFLPVELATAEAAGGDNA